MTQITGSYAAEELIAELGSAFLCAELMLDAEPRADHAPCLEDWLHILKDDRRAIFTAASKAQEAAEWLITAPSGRRISGAPRPPRTIRKLAVYERMLLPELRSRETGPVGYR